MVWAGPRVRRTHPVHLTAKDTVVLALQASDASVDPDAAHLGAADLPVPCREAARDFPRSASADAPEPKVAHQLREHWKPPPDVQSTVAFAFRAKFLAQHLALDHVLDVAQEFPPPVAARESQLELKLELPVGRSAWQDESELEPAHS
jgi:hypothetical protein